MSYSGEFLLSAVFSLLLNRDPDILNVPNELPIGYELIFSDEFEGTELDYSKWGVGINKDNIQHPTNDCAFTENNIFLREGKLVLLQRHENEPVLGKCWDVEGGVRLYDYTCGGVHTNEDFMFGSDMYLEVRLKLPTNDAGYAALWAYSVDDNYTPVNDMLEIDMFEYIANQDMSKMWSGLWWHDFYADEVSKFVSADMIVERSPDHFFVKDFDHKATIGSHYLPKYYYNSTPVDFITFGFKIESGSMAWYLAWNGAAVNSEPYLVYNGGEVYSRAYVEGNAPTDVWIRDVPANLNSRIMLANVLKNALWAGGPINDNQLPSEMLIDYIRIYKIR